MHVLRRLAFDLLRFDRNNAPQGQHPMGEFSFEPIRVNSNAPGGARIMRTFDDIGAFILIKVDIPRRTSPPHWHAVRRDLAQARSGERQAEVHHVLQLALAQKGWPAA